jgi:hypothetical protein
MIHTTESSRGRNGILVFLFREDAHVAHELKRTGNGNNLFVSVLHPPEKLNQPRFKVLESFDPFTFMIYDLSLAVNSFLLIGTDQLNSRIIKMTQYNIPEFAILANACVFIFAHKMEFSQIYHFQPYFNNRVVFY